MPRRKVVVVWVDAALIVILAGTIVAGGFHVLAAQWVAAVSAAVPILITLIQLPPSPPPPEDAARDLAPKLALQARDSWAAELPSRGLEPGRLMEVRWRRADGSLQVPGLGDDGTLTQLTDSIARDAEQRGEDRRPLRVVVTGELGAGKTAACVLLMVDVAERDGRVPVFLQLAAWDPETSLKGWIARRLPEIFPVLGTTKYDRRVADILAERHILPILDGLDEMRDPAAALRAIDDKMGGLPFVLTSRTTEFCAANDGGVLHQALIVELQPLRPDEVRGILLDYEPPSANGPLAPLVAKLEDDPAGSFAEALSTPFMVSLARDTRASLPELLAGTAGPGAADLIRQHLLGTFIRRAYTGDEGAGLAGARRCLRFLAQRTDPAGRLAWWRLHLAVPRAMFVIVAACIGGGACSALAAIFFSLFGRPLEGFWIGLGAGVAGAFIVELVPQDDPRRARPRLRSVRVPASGELARTLGLGLIGGAALAVIVWALYGTAGYIAVGGVLSGLTFAAARYLSQPNDPLKVITPASLLRTDRAAVLYAALAGAIPGALTGAYLGFSFRAGHRPSLDSLELLRYPAPVLALLGAASGCVLSGAGLGLMAMGSSSWGRFNWTRLWLAGRGATPLRLMTFLQDAHRRGILRQANGYYEFRHRALRDYLAEPSPELSVGPSGTAADAIAPS